jgi:hypothetical protein
MVLGGWRAVLITTPTTNWRSDYARFCGVHTPAIQNGQPYIAEEYQPDDDYWLVDVPNRSEHSLFDVRRPDHQATGLGPRGQHRRDQPAGPISRGKIPYHQHEITIVWDQVDRYGLGNGLHCW